MLLESIELLVPEPLVLMHPARYLAERFAAKRDEDFATLFLAFNQSRSFEQLEVLGHCVQGGVERPGDLQESRRSVCQPADDCAPGGVRNGGQDIRQLIHDKHYTQRCNVWQADFFVFDLPARRKKMAP